MDDNTEKVGLGFWSGLMRDVFQHHDEMELEKRWAGGTIGNIPSLEQVNTDCPRPWLFARMFGLALITYLIFLYCWNRFHAVNVLPGLIIVGTAVVPLCMVVFFFELNARRNVSVFLAGRMMALGGALAVVFSLFMFQLTSMAARGWMGASVSGMAEEVGKLVAVLILIRSKRYPYILNGLLFGAAVGAGFAAYESAGYALTLLVSGIIHATLSNADKIVTSLNTMSGAQVNIMQVLGEIYTLFAANVDGVMLGNIALRGLLAPFCHIVWTAIVAGGLWMVKGDKKFKPVMMVDIRFVGCLVYAMVLHAVWNSPWELKFITSVDKYLVLGVLGWMVVLMIVRRGLKQLADEKARLSVEMSIALAPSQVTSPNTTLSNTIEDGLTEIIHIQTVYVEKLVEVPVERKPVDMPQPVNMSKPFYKGYNHLEVAEQAAESRLEEENRERLDLSDRLWYRDYNGGSSGRTEDDSLDEGGSSRRRWEKYYQRGDKKHDREK